MAGNTFGKIFRLTTFGESHGPGLGGVIDGCPAGLPIDEQRIQADLDLRKPGGALASTKRKEADKIRILSGVFEGVSTGAPIGFYIANEDQRSRDYGDLAEIFRPSHADWPYYKKYLGIRDYRGGGRASGRETAARVAAGSVAMQMLEKICGAEIFAATVEFAGICVEEKNIDMRGAASRQFFAANDAVIPFWVKAVEDARQAEDTLGGIVRVEATNIPTGLGEPVFDKLDACLAYAMMGVGAVKGVEIGDGFSSACKRGSANNDSLLPPELPSFRDGRLENCRFASNHAGGIVGGISTGQPIIIRAAIKPTASLAQQQDTIDRHGNAVKLRIGGRHDLAIIPRVVPVLRAMAALTLADAYLLQMRMAAFA